MTLQELINNDLIWNKEQVQVVIEDNVTGKISKSEITRIEFLADTYEDYKIDWFESGIYLNGSAEPCSYIRFHVSKEVQK
jgi:hypothetical protein